MDSPVRSSLADDGAVVVNVLGEIDFTNADEVAHRVLTVTGLDALFGLTGAARSADSSQYAV